MVTLNPLWGVHPIAAVCQSVYDGVVNSHFQTGNSPDLTADERGDETAAWNHFEPPLK